MIGSGAPYRPRVAAESLFFDIRGLRLHVRRWQTGGDVRHRAVFLHGWMDSSVSFQFVVDHLGPGWSVAAPDWRGFGLSQRAAADCYWFPDYLADLDRLLDEVVPGGAVDLVAHSMGGNIAMLYAGVRPDRVRRLINLEGVGMRATRPREAPARYAGWLDQIRRGREMRRYPSREALARRLCADNPRLPFNVLELYALADALEAEVVAGCAE